MPVVMTIKLDLLSTGEVAIEGPTNMTSACLAILEMGKLEVYRVALEATKANSIKTANDAEIAALSAAERLRRNLS